MKSTLFAAAALIAIATPSFAADLGKFGTTPPISPLHNWSGAYVGLQAGFSKNHQDYADRGYGEYEGDNYFLHESVSAFVGGGHAGYNVQRGRFVYGIEGDLEYNSVDNTGEFPGEDWGYYAETGLQGSARVRLGYAFDRSLIYATAGLAIGEFSFRAFCDWCAGPSLSGSMSQVHVGWTAGAGWQYAFNDRVSVRAEYRYTDLGSQTEDVSEYWSDAMGEGNYNYRDTFDLSSHAVRFGVSYALGR